MDPKRQLSAAPSAPATDPALRFVYRANGIPLNNRGADIWKRTVVHPLSTRPAGLMPSACSGPVALRHPKTTTYRCFLPDLTGFIGFRRVRPSLLRRAAAPVPRCLGPRTGIQPRYSGLRVQGTASSPSSTTARHPIIGPLCNVNPGSALWCPPFRGFPEQ